MKFYRFTFETFTLRETYTSLPSALCKVAVYANSKKALYTKNNAKGIITEFHKSRPHRNHSSWF